MRARCRRQLSPVTNRRALRKQFRTILFSTAGLLPDEKNFLKQVAQVALDRHEVDPRSETETGI